MEHGPLPPHERAWRHPSELAAEERAAVLAEPTPRSTRFLALTTGTLGLVAIGLLMVTVTPRRIDSPIAISSSTTPTPAFAAGAVTLAGSPAATGPRALRSNIALATPIGDGTFAVVTRASLVDTSAAVIDVRLPSGRQSTGAIVTASDDAVIVALASAETGRAVARERPADHDVVTVMATPPVTVAFHDIAALAVDEGTAVVDDSGRLVGICSHGRGGVRLIEVSAALDAATSVVP